MKRLGSLLSLLLLLCLLPAAALAASTAGTLNADGYPESAHPYADNCDIVWTYQHPTEADFMAISFSSDSELQNSYDKLYVRTDSGDDITLTGAFGGKMVLVHGNTVTLNLVTNGNTEKQGFTVTNIVALTQEEYGLAQCFTVADGALTAYNGSDTEVVIPAQVGGQTITRIAQNVFLNNADLTSVVIPDTVTRIDKQAFYKCSNLTSITLSSALTSIGTSAFFKCYGIVNLVLPESLQSIGTSAFEECTNLASVSFPAALKNIDKKAFYDCGALTSAVLPEGLQIIGSSAFYGCSALAEITFPASLTAIENYTFYGCSALTEITLPAGLTTIGDSAFRFCNKLAEVAFPTGLKSIGSYAFYNCVGLTEVTLPEGLETVGDQAFAYCHYITSITIPASLTAINDTMFPISSSYASRLTAFNVAEGNPVYTSVDGVLIDKTTHTLLLYPRCKSGTTYQIPEGVEKIGDNAFSNPDFSTLVLSASLSDLSNIVSRCYYNLRQIEVPAENPYFKSVDGVIFSQNGGTLWYYPVSASANAYTVPQGVTAIGPYAFYRQPSLNSVTLPQGLETIGNYAFYDCSLKNVVIPEGTTAIGARAFSSCGNLGSVSLPESLRTIGNSAFYSCVMLKNMVIPEGTASIGTSAFYNCEKMESISLPESLQTIGSSSFYYCSKLTRFEVKNAQVTFPDSLFYDCPFLVIVGYEGSTAQTYASQKGLKFANIADEFRQAENSINGYDGTEVNIVVPSERNGYTITKIGNNAFQNSNIQSIVLPDTVTVLGDYVFDGAASLTSVTLPDSITQIGRFAFQNCASLTSVKLPAGLTAMWRYMFKGCTALTNVTLPEGLTEIGINCFDGCTSLSRITIPASVTKISDYVFANLTQPITVTILNDNIALGSNGFSNSAFGNTASSLVTIQGREGSKAQSYASSKGYKFAVYKDEIASGICGRNLTWSLAPDGKLTISGTGPMDDYTMRENKAPWDEYKYDIETVQIKYGVTSIGRWAFAECYLTNITIPSSVYDIRPGAFAYAHLTDITIPSGVKIIDTFAFYNCTLTNITIPSSVTTIGASAFSSCFNLTDITIPSSVTSIGDWAFESCVGLTSITIPASVTSIGSNPFNYCVSLMNIQVEAGNTCVVSEDGVLFNIDKTTIIGYPGGRTGSYTIPSSVTAIGSKAFNGCANLTGVTIPDSVTSIGNAAFAGCDLLTNVTIPEGVTSIEGSTFTGCDALTNVIIPSSVTSIDDSAFRYCSSLSSITIPSSVTSIGKYVFMDCPAELVIHGIPGSYVQTWAAENDLTFEAIGEVNPVMDEPDFVLPASLTAIQEEAFAGISASVVKLGENVTSIGAKAFADCSSLRQIYIPSATASIHETAFLNVNGLTIFGEAGSYAQTYANERGYAFVSVE